MRTAKFFLGTHQPHWLGTLSVPLCIARQRLVRRRTFPRANVPWMLDSGAFSQIAAHGRWTISSRAYATEVRHLAAEIGKLVQVAPQDWMCEPGMIQKTGLSVRRHQSLTVDNYLDLLDLGVEGIFPVLQGWTSDDYIRHVDEYDRRGVQLDRLPLVGIGSICRRQAEDEISNILHKVAGLSIKLHGFGVKMKGVAKAGCSLNSADSMAWSYNARRNPRLSNCTTHKNCSNCEKWALAWRTKFLAALEGFRCQICQ